MVSGTIKPAAATQPLLFALDIGTRSVIGIVGRQENGFFRVEDLAVREHAQRAMMDGQIEDIDQVAALARTVKEELEARQGVALPQVCVAAAGRALKTVRASSELALQEGQAITGQTVYQLKMDAVAKARAQLLEETGNEMQFSCVGCAVQRYRIDDYVFSKIKGHKGHKAQAEVIATFLPEEVVESLYATMAQAGLLVESLTLEPIAAMNAVIPSELHLLNLALVDVGAGTSDIALSDAGGISGYDMVTMAGDEITEAIIHACLVDFQTAEQMKQAAQNDATEEIAFEDILGNACTLSREAVLDFMRPAVEELAQVIADKILKANGKAPSAVFLVGGGSKTPFLCQLMAERLGMDSRKVAIGGNNFMKRIVSSSLTLTDPVYATPLGIALTAAADDSRESFFVTVNDKKVLAFYARTLSVLDVLLMSGYQYRELMGQSGKNLTYTLDGQPVTVRGGHMEPAQITINGMHAGISTAVSKGDVVVVKPAVAGEDAHVTAVQAQRAQMRNKGFAVTLSGAACAVYRALLRDGNILLPTDEIHAGDALLQGDFPSLRMLCTQLSLPLVAYCDETDAPIAPDAPLAPGTVLRRVDEKPMQERHDFADAPPIAVPAPTFAPLSALPQNEKKAQPAQIASISVALPEQAAESGAAVSAGAFAQSVAEEKTIAQNMMRIVLNGNTETLAPRGTPYRLIDMLNYVEIDFSDPSENLVLLRNGRAVSYLEELADGDAVEISAVAKI